MSDLQSQPQTSGFNYARHYANQPDQRQDSTTVPHNEEDLVTGLHLLHIPDDNDRLPTIQSQTPTDNLSGSTVLRPISHATSDLPHSRWEPQPQEQPEPKQKPKARTRPHPKKQPQPKPPYPSRTPAVSQYTIPVMPPRTVVEDRQPRSGSLQPDRWVCCNCNGDCSIALHAGCLDCNNHWRCSGCTVYKIDRRM
jgi:hypothetical protein